MKKTYITPAASVVYLNPAHLLKTSELGGGGSQEIVDTDSKSFSGFVWDDEEK